MNIGNPAGSSVARRPSTEGFCSPDGSAVPARSGYLFPF